jgi:hypothetical protein
MLAIVVGRQFARHFAAVVVAARLKDARLALVTLAAERALRAVERARLIRSHLSTSPKSTPMTSPIHPKMALCRSQWASWQ